MKKIFIFIFLISLSTTTFSQEDIKTFFNLNFTLNPILSESNIIRGTTLSLSRFITEEFFWGGSIRIMHENYTSLLGNIGYNINLNTRLSLPISIGAGLGLNNFDFNNLTDESFNTFLHAQTGLEWNIDQFWKYCLYVSYNYNFQDEETNRLFVNIGVLYLF
ncbi:MAG: porin family protein [Spirochaetaceae bacterium]